MDDAVPDQPILLTIKEARGLTRLARTWTHSSYELRTIAGELDRLVDWHSLADDLVVSIGDGEEPTVTIEEDGWITLRGRGVTDITRRRGPVEGGDLDDAVLRFRELRRAIDTAHRGDGVSPHIVIVLDRDDAKEPDRYKLDLKPVGAP